MPVRSGDKIATGSSIAVIARAESGYEVQSVTINGEDKTAQCSSAYGYNYVANSDVDIQATYAMITSIDFKEESKMSAYADRNGAIVVENAPVGSIAKIYDATGRNVSETNIVSDKATISDDRLPEGLYIVKITYKNNQKSYKVTKRP
jgi:hypothetical protein